MTERKPNTPPIAWHDILSSARPAILIAIEFLLRTKRLAPYSNALRLLSIAIDKLIPESNDAAIIAAIRATQCELSSLGKAKPAKQRAVLVKLKNQVAEL